MLILLGQRSEVRRKYALYKRVLMGSVSVCPVKGANITMYANLTGLCIHKTVAITTKSSSPKGRRIITGLYVYMYWLRVCNVVISLRHMLVKMFTLIIDKMAGTKKTGSNVKTSGQHCMNGIKIRDFHHKVAGNETASTGSESKTRPAQGQSMTQSTLPSQSRHLNNSSSQNA